MRLRKESWLFQGHSKWGEEKELEPSDPSDNAQHCLMMQSFVMSAVFTGGFSITKRANMLTYLYL